MAVAVPLGPRAASTAASYSWPTPMVNAVCSVPSGLTLSMASVASCRVTAGPAWCVPSVKVTRVRDRFSTPLLAELVSTSSSALMPSTTAP